MSGTHLEATPPQERPEIVDFAISLMTAGLGDPLSTALPECVDGAEAARLVSRRFGLSERQAQRYVALARDLIAAEFQADLPARARLLSSVSLAVVREAYRDRHWNGVNGAVKNLCAIYGIDAKVTIKNGGSGVDALLEAIKTSPSQRDAEIAALEAKEREDSSGGAEPG